MIPVFTKEAQASLVGYLTNSCVAFLINLPELGITDTPTVEELDLRLALTMIEAVSYEVGGFNLNGYQRARPQISIENDSTIRYNATFRAEGGVVGPFTHICISRGSIFTDDPSTGNGRGSTEGQLLLVVPVLLPEGQSSLILNDGQSYEVSIPLSINKV